MLPPPTRRSGSGAKLVPLRSVSCAATADQDSMASRRAAPRASGVRCRQLRQARPLRAQERAEAESVVETRQRRKVGRAAHEPGGADAERQGAGDWGEPPREIHRVAMRGEACAEGARPADLEAGDALEIVV